MAPWNFSGGCRSRLQLLQSVPFYTKTAPSKSKRLPVFLYIFLLKLFFFCAPHIKRVCGYVCPLELSLDRVIPPFYYCYYRDLSPASYVCAS